MSTSYHVYIYIFKSVREDQKEENDEIEKMSLTFTLDLKFIFVNQSSLNKKNFGFLSITLYIPLYTAGKINL